MKPTNQLRWVEVEESDIKEPVGLMPSAYIGETYYVLQQLWKDEDNPDNKEWRTITENE